MERSRIIMIFYFLILIFCLQIVSLPNAYSLDDLGDIDTNDESLLVICKQSTVYYKKALILEDVFWVYAVEEVNISGIEIPAGTTALVIMLRNIANCTVKNITVNFDSLLKITECNETTKHYNDSLSPGYSITFAFTVTLRENASASQYDLPLDITYYIDDYLYSYQIIVPVAVTGVPVIKVKAQPLHVSEEGIYDLEISVLNIGTAPARRVTAILIGSPPYVTTYGDDWFELGIIPANKSKNVNFSLYVTQMPTTTIPVLINISFMDERYGNFYSVSESVLVIYNETPRVILVSSGYVPTAVFPGDTFVKLSVTIANPTNKILEDVEAQLILPEDFSPSYAGSDQVSLGSLLPGQTVTLQFYVDVSEEATPGLRNLDLKISFSKGESNHEVPIIIKEKARFNITSFHPRVLTAGARGVNFRVSIKNIAKVDAEAVYLQLMGGTILKGEVVTYIGKIIAGEEVSVTFNIEISDTAPIGPTSLDFKVTWTQEERILVEIYKIYVYISAGQGLASLTGTIIGFSLVVTGILLLPLIKELKKRYIRGETE